MARLKDINEYAGTSVNPMDHPDQIYELYSVPSYETGAPEIISGGEIGSSKVTVEEGDVLICKINPRINRVWVVKHTTGYPLLASSEWIVVRNKEMNPSYLRWYFMSPNFRTLLASQVTGIGGSLTRAQPKQVATYPVPIAERAEQDRVATTLELVEMLIKKNSDRLKLLDDLVKSQFIEMFGSKDFPAFMLSELCSKITDGTHKTPDYQTSGITFISAKNIVDGKLNFSDVKYIIQAEYEEIQKRCMTERGDVLMSKSGSLGSVAIVDTDEPLGLFESLAVLKYDRSKLDGIFLMEQLRSDKVQQKLMTGVKGVAVKHLHLNVIAGTKIIVPPMDLQNEFAAFVKQTDKSKFAIKQSLTELETLKKSLMQQYFG